MNRLQGNIITSKSACLLFDTLREGESTISKLNLSETQINDESMKQLGEYLQDNNHLEELYLYSTMITDKGVEVLSDYLVGNTKLKEIDLRSNKLIQSGSVPFILHIAKTTHISVIKAWGTAIPFDKHKEIEEAFNIAIDQRQIPIKSNSKSASKIQSTPTSSTTAQ